MKISREAEVLNHQYRQNYCKTLKMWYLQTKITGKKYCKIPKRHGCFLTQHTLINMDQLRMIRRRTGKGSASPGGNETIVWNIYSYQILAMVGTNASTNEKHKFYNSTVQAISSEGRYCATNVGALWAHFFLHVIPSENLGGKWTEKALWFPGTDHWCVWPSRFRLKLFRSSWWRRKENKYKWPSHSSPEAIRYFFVFNDDRPTIPGWSKLQAQSHDLQCLC